MTEPTKEKLQNMMEKKGWCREDIHITSLDKTETRYVKDGFDITEKQIKNILNDYTTNQRIREAIEKCIIKDGVHGDTDDIIYPWALLKELGLE